MGLGIEINSPEPSNSTAPPSGPVVQVGVPAKNPLLPLPVASETEVPNPSLSVQCAAKVGTSSKEYSMCNFAAAKASPSNDSAVLEPAPSMIKARLLPADQPPRSTTSLTNDDKSGDWCFTSTVSQAPSVHETTESVVGREVMSFNADVNVEALSVA